MKHSTKKSILKALVALSFCAPLFSADWEDLKSELLEKYSTRPDITPHVKIMTNSDSAIATTFVHKRTLSPEQQAFYDTYYATSQKKVYDAYIEARKVAFDAIKETTDRNTLSLILFASLSKYINSDSLPARYIAHAAVSEALGEAFTPQFIYSSAHIYAHNNAIHTNSSTELYKQINVLIAEKQSAFAKITAIEQASAQKEKELTAKIAKIEAAKASQKEELVLQTLTMQNALAQTVSQLAQIRLDNISTQTLYDNFHAARQACADTYHAKIETAHDSALPIEDLDAHDTTKLSILDKPTLEEIQMAVLYKKATTDPKFSELMAQLQATKQLDTTNKNMADFEENIKAAHHLIQQINTIFRPFDRNLCETSYEKVKAYTAKPLSIRLHDARVAAEVKELALPSPTAEIIASIRLDNEHKKKHAIIQDAIAAAQLLQATRPETLSDDIDAKVATKKAALLAQLAFESDLAEVRKIYANRYQNKKNGFKEDESIKSHLAIRNEARAIAENIGFSPTNRLQ